MAVVNDDRSRWSYDRSRWAATTAARWSHHGVEGTERLVVNPADSIYGPMSKCECRRTTSRQASQRTRGFLANSGRVVRCGAE